MKRIKLTIIAMMVVSVVISSASNVSAWGVAYGQKNVNMKAGETRIIRTSLQNMVNDEEITIFVEIEGDKDIAELSETEVDLPPKTRSHPVYITVTMPNDPEDSYKIKAVYTQSANGGVMVDMATQKVLTFNINTAEEQEPPSNPPSDDDNGDTDSPNDWTPIDTDDGDDEQDKIDSDKEDETNQNKNQPKLVENVPREELNNTLNQQEPQQDQSGGWIMWLIGAMAIIGIIGYLWWDGWI